MLALKAVTASEVGVVATLTIRGLDEETRDRLRVRAAQHGRSMEAEVREILHELLFSPAPTYGLGSHIHARFAAVGGVDLDLPARHEAPRAAVFET
ncbi:MAG: FitA-like ribbon-helix-helix domain-containing protein [Pseudonocardiaceae bacterium]